MAAISFWSEGEIAREGVEGDGVRPSVAPAKRFEMKRVALSVILCAASFAFESVRYVKEPSVSIAKRYAGNDSRAAASPLRPASARASASVSRFSAAVENVRMYPAGGSRDGVCIGAVYSYAPKSALAPRMIRPKKAYMYVLYQGVR